VQGVTTSDGCRQACSDNAACVGWTLTYGKCYIKSSVGCMTYDPAAESGYCRPWEGPPQCGYHSHAPLQATAVYCNPTLTDPPQFCPGGIACPNCGSDSCACPTGPSPPSPTPPPSTGCSNSWATNNNGGVNIPPGDNPVQGVTTSDGCRQACSDNAACVGWTLTYGKCYIKSSVGCMTYDPAAESGYCRPWEGPPQCGYHSHAPLQAPASRAGNSTSDNLQSALGQITYCSDPSDVQGPHAASCQWMKTAGDDCRNNDPNACRCRDYNSVLHKCSICPGNPCEKRYCFDIRDLPDNSCQWMYNDGDDCKSMDPNAEACRQANAHNCGPCPR